MSGEQKSATCPSTFRPPRQARSRDTQRRIVAAAQELLSEKPAEAVTIADITHRAVSSVGAFYARFPDKGALLRHLDELYATEVARFERHFRHDPQWRSALPREFLGALILFYVKLHKKYAGLLRARLHGGPEFAVRVPGSRRDRRGLPGTAFLARELMCYRRVIPHPDPRGASELGAMMVMGAIRERVLFGGVPGASAMTEKVLAGELADALIAYLGINPEALVRSANDDERGPV